MKSLFINVVMKRFCLFLSFFVLLSSCDKQAEPQAPGQEQDNPGDPGGEVVPPPADVPDMFSVKTLFGNVGFNNAADKKKGGDASTAILGSVRGLGMISAGKAFVLEQAQTIRLWDMEQKTLSEPITYGDGNHVPWLGTVNAGKVWFAEKAKAKVMSFDPSTRSVKEEAAVDSWAGKSVMSIQFDASGNAWVAVRDLNTIFKYPGTDFNSAPLLTIDLGHWPQAMRFDADGFLIVATNGCQILAVNPENGSIQVIAGVENAKSFDDGKPGLPMTAKFMASIADLVIAPNGDIYVGDHSRVRQIRKGSAGYYNATVTTVAGGASQSDRSKIADGVGTEASFKQIGGLMLSDDGKTIYISDQGSGHIRSLYIGDGTVPEQKGEEQLTAGTFNIRFLNDADTGNKRWDKRKGYVVQLLRDASFDVVAFQESRPEQRTYLSQQLPEYTFYESAEEPCVAWRKDKYTELEKGLFYLSPTPDVPSTPYPGWVETDPGRKRLCQWVKLEDKALKQKFFFLNTHLEVASSGTSISEDEAKQIRIKSAELILAKVKELNSEALPLILCGDMNSMPTEATNNDYFKGYFSDAYYRSAELGVNPSPIASYNGWSDTAEQAGKWYHRVDYQYFIGDIDVLRYQVLRYTYGGVMPSDHWPVLVDYRFTK